eukprot:1901230-Rhodomonas_salina.1
MSSSDEPVGPTSALPPLPPPPRLWFPALLPPPPRLRFPPPLPLGLMPKSSVAGSDTSSSTHSTSRLGLGCPPLLP